MVNEFVIDVANCVQDRMFYFILKNKESIVIKSADEIENSDSVNNYWRNVTGII